MCIRDRFNISPYINTDGSGSVKCNFYLDNKYKDAETFVIKFYKKGALVKSSSVSVPSNVNIYSESISGIPNGDYIVKFTPTSDVMRVKESSQEVSIIPDNETSLNVLAAQMVYKMCIRDRSIFIPVIFKSSTAISRLSSLSSASNTLRPFKTGFG